MWTFTAGGASPVRTYHQLYRQIDGAPGIPKNVGIAILQAAIFLMATAKEGESIDAVQCEVIRDINGRFHYNLSIST